MLFNSYEFIFIFLPITLLGFHLIGKHKRHRLAIAWLVGASLFFYGWWNPAYLGLLLFSILFNYSIGVSLSSGLDDALSRKVTLIVGVIVNLSVLGYFKYANFFIDNLNILTNSNIILYEIILPLGISFFTFQQITYLVDAYYQETKEYNFLHYCLFVTFFPQLIAGPIVHHKEMLPQFAKDAVYKLRSKHLAIGMTIFTLGLFKKVVLADSMLVYATPVFDAAEAGVILTFFEAWTGALAYTFQLYFDFSGYSDMAIGLARMFGIRLPLNFNSPYKATNISDFWRRWHITLSRLIRNYLWDPISLFLTRYALNREYGKIRIFVLTIVIPVFFSFFWIGLWHGAGWNFIIFGFMHGFYIVIFNLWTNLKLNFSVFRLIKNSIVSILLGWLITFICVVLGWVLFRAESIDGAKKILQSMIGMNGISLPRSLENISVNYGLSLPANIFTFDGMFHNSFSRNVNYFDAFSWILILLIMSTSLPNTQQFMRNYKPAFEIFKGEITKTRHIWIEWKTTVFWALFTSIILFISILSLSGESEFLYFQF